MTQYYLWYFPDAGECVVKSIGLHKPRIIIYKKDGETDDIFKRRAVLEFDELFDFWLKQVGPDFRRAEIISTKTLQ